MNPLIIGCIVHDGIRSAPEDHFGTCIMSFLAGMLDVNDLPKLDGSGTIFSEADSFHITSFGSMVRFKMSKDDIETVRASYFEQTDSDEDDGEYEFEPQSFIVVGSHSFCSGVLEFLFVNEDGEVSQDGQSMINVVSGQPSGTVVVSKDGVEDLIIDNITEMFVRAKAAAQQ